MKANLNFCSLFAVLTAGWFTLDLHAAPGGLDSLDPNIAGTTVYAMAVQRDGKIIIGGSFTSVLGIPRTNVARLNADGTLDAGFDLNPSAVGTVSAIALQPDGKLLLGDTSGVRRFNVDGMLDLWFDPHPNLNVYSIAVQSDAKVLLGGDFTTLRPNGAPTATARHHVARVNSDGTLDTGFDPNASDSVHTLAVQSDGKVLLGGYFQSLQPNGAPAPTTRHFIARVNADGTLDTTFDPNPNSHVHCIAVQADGRVVFGGDFTTLQPNGAPTTTARRNLARVNADGTVDSGFDPSPMGQMRSIALLADATMVIGGDFTYLQPNGSPPQLRSRIARVYADGTLDMAFDPKANLTVHSVAVQADGRVLIGGEFTRLQPNGAPTPTTRNHFARLQGYPTGQTLSIVELPKYSELRWHRAGATPELTRATFQLSQDNGATFGSPVVASRSGGTADWRILLLSVSGSGVWRARGYTGDGQYNGSSSMIEQLLAFGAPDSRRPIPGLFNTGVDSAGTPLIHEQLDGHYTLFPSPLGGTPIVLTWVGGYPIPPWVDYADPLSEWITPLGFSSDPGDYVYQTTFDLTGMDLATASITGRLATDNTGIDILINGASTGQTSSGFTAFTPFEITSGFITGVNTLAFKVNNAGDSPNPSGLRVEMVGLAAPDLRLRFTDINSGHVTLSWISQPGHSYRVYSKSSLLDPDWTEVPEDVIATNGVSSKMILISNAGSAFYRVALLP